MKSNCGKLLVYTPKMASHKERLKVIKAAVEKTAKTLNLEFEVVAFKGNTPIYVYYKDDAAEPVPLYCDGEGEKSLEQVCNTLRSMIFVLSFHPKYAALKRIRRAAMKFS
ncbi:MAG: hypothetical protein QXG58_05770 [Candidatus Bathyarchaeia archaeon]